MNWEAEVFQDRLWCADDEEEGSLASSAWFLQTGAVRCAASQS